MDEARAVNWVELKGTVSRFPAFSHQSRGERFFQFSIEIARLSGAQDEINIIAREALVECLQISRSPKIAVSGELRSFNNKNGEGNKLVITVFAKELRFDSGEDVNSVGLHGTLCKPPNLRTTPMGREICDIMLAVNRRYGRSDYLPCIAWGLHARDVSGWEVGESVELSGRIQSRKYIKMIDGAPVEKTAFEVSIIDIRRAPPAPEPV